MGQPLVKISGGRKRSDGGQRGFTLLELLVVVVILGVLAALAIPAYTSYVDKARITLAVSSMDAMRKSLMAFHADHDEYPAHIDFATGHDDLGRKVFPQLLLAQVADDLLGTPVYNRVGADYLMTAQARDGKATVLTMTPSEITY